MQGSGRLKHKFADEGLKEILALAYTVPVVQLATGSRRLIGRILALLLDQIYASARFSVLHTATCQTSEL